MKVKEVKKPVGYLIDSDRNPSRGLWNKPQEPKKEPMSWRFEEESELSRPQHYLNQSG